MSGHGGDVKTCDWHPCKSVVASGSKDTVIKLWDARAGSASLATLHGHRATVMQVHPPGSPCVGPVPLSRRQGWGVLECQHSLTAGEMCAVGHERQVVLQAIRTGGELSAHTPFWMM